MSAGRCSRIWPIPGVCGWRAKWQPRSWPANPQSVQPVAVRSLLTESVLLWLSNLRSMSMAEASTQDITRNFCGAKSIETAQTKAHRLPVDQAAAMIYKWDIGQAHPHAGTWACAYKCSQSPQAQELLTKGSNALSNTGRHTVFTMFNAKPQLSISWPLQFRMHAEQLS